MAIYWVCDTDTKTPMHFLLYQTLPFLKNACLLNLKLLLFDQLPSKNIMSITNNFGIAILKPAKNNNTLADTYLLYRAMLKFRIIYTSVGETSLSLILFSLVSFIGLSIFLHISFFSPL